MKGFFDSFKIGYILIAVVLLSSCAGKKAEGENDDSINMVGKWNVQWVTTPDPNMPSDEGINYTMNGVFDIERSGKITISAYGYDNCIFGKDTLVHSLEWELLGDTLNVKNKGDEFGMPYKILQATEDKIKLQLVEDVYLFLSK